MSDLFGIVSAIISQSTIIQIVQTKQALVQLRRPPECRGDNAGQEIDASVCVSVFHIQITLHYITCHLADAFIQSDLQ